MENAVEALKIAFAVMMFVLALTISISSFSNANSAVKSLISMNDRENEYTYVEPTDGGTRTVGVETVVTSMYRAMEQNIEIYFKEDENDDEFMKLFYKTDMNEDGYIWKESGVPVVIDSIDLSNDSPKYEKMYIDIILGGKSVITDIVEQYLSDASEEEKEMYIDMYNAKLNYYDYPTDGLYDYFKDKKFKEEFGEYIQGEKSSEITKRVITYTIID